MNAAPTTRAIDKARASPSLPAVADYDLPVKQYEFVIEFVLGECRSQGAAAAELAGYAKSGAGKRANAILKNPEAQRLVADIQTCLLAESMMSVDDARLFLTDVIYDKVEGVDEVVMRDRLAALALLGKIQGWVGGTGTGDGGGVVVVIENHLAEATEPRMIEAQKADG